MTVEKRKYIVDGTVWVEWNECQGLDPTDGPAPFMRGCETPPKFCETIDAFGEVWVLGYCNEHKYQMQRYRT